MVSKVKEKLVSLKKYQYVLWVRPQSKWNKSGLHHVQRHTHRHGFGWRWWVENKAFFEQILISNVHSLAPFFYDWTTESLFVCLMKHIEGYVPELNCLCICVCACVHVCMCADLHASIAFACICYMDGCPHSFWHVRLPLAGIRSHNRRQRWKKS